MGFEPASAVLMLVCTATGGEVDTGIPYSHPELARASRVTLHEDCPFCREAHLFKFSDARLVPKPAHARPESEDSLAESGGLIEHGDPAETELIAELLGNQSRAGPNHGRRRIRVQRRTRTD